MRTFLFLAAPLPLAILVVASIGQYESRLRTETEQRLAARAKDSGIAIFRRLIDLGADLRRYIDDSNAARAGDSPIPTWNDRFRSVSELPPGANPEEVSALRESEVLRLRTGQALLRVEPRGAQGAALWLVVLSTTTPESVVWAEVEIAWILPSLVDPAETDLQWLLLGSDRARILASSQPPEAALVSAIEKLGSDAAGGFSWRDSSGRGHQGRYWTVPLGNEFGYPGLASLVSQVDFLTSEVDSVRRTLVLVALAALLLIFLFGSVRLRADLEPLETLAEGTRRLADGDLSVRVKIEGATDLERLGAAFNSMAEGLERQFHLLETSHAVAASALAPASGSREIAEQFLAGVSRLMPRARVRVLLLEQGGRERADPSRPDDAGAGVEILSRLPEVLRGPLRGAEGWVRFVATTSTTAGTEEAREALAFALRREDRIQGAVLLGAFEASCDLSAEAELLRGPIHQLAVALARVRLMEDLSRANLGALTVLARAVDAKSSWTHGHSERVVTISLALASELELGDDEQRIIRRGGLLHDVGKIGVPNEILDKASPLTRDEQALMRTHVEKGVRIIEPMESFHDVLPIVWQHHERLDGSGYPRGLSGTAIDPIAALVAVADVFEALTASRPYRIAMTADEALAHLVERSGREFDARVVAALERVRDTSWRWPFVEG